MSKSTYSCIYCGGILFFNNAILSCLQCSSKFEIRNGIPILARRERYWCNFSKDKMILLNRDARNTYWKEAVKNHIGGNLANNISDELRIDFRYFLPSLKEKRVLDIGSMWGSIGIPIAKYAREVYCIDTTYETLELLNIRMKQDKVHNINIALSSANKLPFVDKFFDIVLLVGVLEWLGSDYDFVVSEHYGQKGKVEYRQKGRPRQLQLEAIKEIFRVLKPESILLIGIENRFYYKYFFGWPEDHTKVPFLSILPRFLANIYMRISKQRDYYEYTYSYNQYKKLLKSVGFNCLTFYAAMPSYRKPEIIIPINDNKCIEYYYRNYGLGELDGFKRWIPQFIINLRIMKYFVPSFIILAER